MTVYAVEWVDRANEWMATGEVGRSSKAIWLHFMHAQHTPLDVPAPYDPDDFRRCYILLNRVPEWRPRIVEMARYNREWAGLSAVWEELTALYEAKAGADPEHPPRGTMMSELYDRIREARGERSPSDPPTQLKPRKPRKGDHVVMVMQNTDPAERAAHLKCEHCGERFVIDKPLRVELFTGITQSFSKLHRDCKPAPPSSR